ncbi:MAG: hypothetical protein CSA21_02725 [Deltaproteobacteria bacterium]|nr:MAG: hypothetical protein CSA21_02725 [Deltaproteobacteria bacterium]
MNIRSLSLALVSLFFVCSLSSCAAVILGGAGAAGTYSYFEGKTSVSRNISVNKAYAAALKACKKLGLPIEKKSKNLSEASITGKDGDRTFWIWISAENTVRTKISVRVGLFGDEPASQKIQDTLAACLTTSS